MLKFINLHPDSYVKYLDVYTSVDQMLNKKLEWTRISINCDESNDNMAKTYKFILRIKLPPECDLDTAVNAYTNAIGEYKKVLEELDIPFQNPRFLND